MSGLSPSVAGGIARLRGALVAGVGQGVAACCGGTISGCLRTSPVVLVRSLRLAVGCSDCGPSVGWCASRGK